MNPRQHRWFGVTAAVVCAVSAAAGQPPGAESAQQQLRQVLSPKDAAGQVRLVRGLASLRDPSLAPLFAQLENAKSSVIRVEALLALAQLTPEKGLDLLPVRKLDPAAQAMVLSRAIDEGLATTEQLEDLARWPDLQAGLLVSVAGRLVAAQRRVDPVRLRAVAAGDDPIVGTVAALLLKQMGLPTPEGAEAKLLAAIKAPGAADAVRRMLVVIRDRRLTSGAGFASRCLEQSGSDRLLRFEAVRTLLMVETSGERVAQMVGEEMRLAADSAERVRLALAVAFAALERDAGIPSTVIETLRRAEESDIKALAEAIESYVAKSSAGIEALARGGSAPLLSWALRAAERLPADPARAVRLAVIGGALDSSDRTVEAAAADAARDLAQSDPGSLAEPLRTAVQRGDSRTAGRILAGALRSTNPGAVELASVGRGVLDREGDGPPWPGPGVEAVATLVKGRFSAKPDAVLVKELTAVAAGRGSLPDSARMQAAWLALKGSGDERAALAMVLSALSP